MPVTLCVGTSAHGAWFSNDLGETFERPTSKAGLYLESAIFSIAKHKARPNMMLAGTDRGIYRWDFNEKHWFHEPSPMDAGGYSIWTLLRADHDPKIMLAGTRPAEFYRSDDDGKNWRLMLTEVRGCFWLPDILRAERLRGLCLPLSPGGSKGWINSLPPARVEIHSTPERILICWR